MLFIGFTAVFVRISAYQFIENWTLFLNSFIVSIVVARFMILPSDIAIFALVCFFQFSGVQISMSMNFFWTQWIYLGATILTTPLYLSIIIVTIKDWKNAGRQKTIHLLTISQGFADLFSSVNSIVFVTARYSGLFDWIFWELQHYYVATWCLDQFYLTVVLRTLGILLITVHRYLTMCRDGSALERWSNTDYRWILVLVHWIFPFVYIISTIGRDLIPFVSPDDLSINPPSHLIPVANAVSFFFVCPAFAVSFLCYSAILRFLYKHRMEKSMSLQRERRVCVQMVGVVIAFAFVTIYNILQFHFSMTDHKDAIRAMRRSIYPVLTCFLSYVSPWMMVLTSADLRRKLRAFYGLNKDRVGSFSAVVVGMPGMASVGGSSWTKSKTAIHIDVKKQQRGC